jgi:hypothetical protein
MAYFPTNLSEFPVSCRNASDGGVILSHSLPSPPYSYHWLNGPGVTDVRNFSATPTNFINSHGAWQSFRSTKQGIIDGLYLYVDVQTLPYTGILLTREGRGVGSFVTSSHLIELPPGSQGWVRFDLYNGLILSPGDEFTVNILAISGTLNLGIDTNLSYPDGELGGVVAPPGADLIFGIDAVEEIPANIVSTVQSPVGIFPPGKYNVIIRDSAGNLGYGGLAVRNPPELIISPVSVQNPSAPGMSDGSITIDVNGGRFPYLINWAHGPSGTSISGLGVGTYTVEVRDVTACIRTMDFTLTTSLASRPPDPCPGLVVQPRLVISEGEMGNFLTILDENYARILNFEVTPGTLDALADSSLVEKTSPEV